MTARCPAAARKATIVPELPEVETIRRDLDKDVVGRRIKEVSVSGMRSIRRHPNKKHFITKLEGHKIVSVSRRGKYLLLRLDSPDVLVAHLGMSGQLLRWKPKPKDPLPKHAHVSITFTQGGALLFIDPRTFGELFVAAFDELEAQVAELAHLGFDPVEDVLSWTNFAERLVNRRAKLKSILTDQRFMAGLGNIYADEILWTAGLRYDRPSDDLSTQEIRRLWRAIAEILQEAIKHRGSSLSDEQYRDLFGNPGDFQRQHNVYDREGLACRRCRSTIVRVKANGRSTFLCPQCQV